ncbi:hypothetical protein [Actinomadura madurae]|uniref:hypothetical protein n=1 Tax=Actinomadura madurae TaxID=1993 RepID=UPI0020D20F78|nr:hypothetical protein [Actinomadura madurae]MCQ0016323.1 hypothetical protein [Actinomadura madurae]
MMWASVQTGRSAARSTKSVSSPRAEVMRPRARSLIVSSRARTARGVKAAATMRRRREWSGGSWLSIIARTKARSSGVSGSRIWVAPRLEEKRSGERRTCFTSACRKTAQ